MPRSCVRRGMGDDLVLGAVPRSRATDAVLERAVDVAAARARGANGPSSEHILLGTRRERGPAGVGDSRRCRGSGRRCARRRHDPGERRTAVSPERLKQWLLASGGCGSSCSGAGAPVPPVFERYTAEAQRAVRAASETAALAGAPLRRAIAFAARLPARVRELGLRACLRANWPKAIWGPSARRWSARGCTVRAPTARRPASSPPAAREIVAERALSYAYRRGDPWDWYWTPAAGDARRTGPRDRPDRRQRHDGLRTGARSARPDADPRATRR